MVRQCLSAWSSSIQQVARQLYVCLNYHLCKLVIVLAVLIGLQYLIANIFEARQFEPLFTQNSTIYSIVHQRRWINNVTGDSMNSCVNLTLNAVGSASSFVSNISDSSVNATTTPSLTVPLTGKSLCPPIPPNLSKYYETLHFTFLFCCLLVHTEACNETF